MPPLPHWLVFASAVVLPMSAFLFTPPTRLANMVVDAFAVHPKLRNPNISVVYVYGIELRGGERDTFIREFNNANYLDSYRAVSERGRHPVLVQIKQGRKKFEFKMYLHSDHTIQMIRVKHRKAIPYRVSSKPLVDLLRSRMQYEWWLH